MGKIFDLLKSSAGSAGSLRNAIGKWRQAVSEALDASASPQYAFGLGVSAQGAVGVNTDLEFEGVGLVNGIPRTVGNPDAWALTPGNVYMLRGIGFFDTFSDAATGVLNVEWVDSANNPLIAGAIAGPNAKFTPATGTDARSTSGALEFLYLCPVTPALTEVKLRVTSATGTANKPAEAWSVSIVQIPNG